MSECVILERIVYGVVGCRKTENMKKKIAHVIHINAIRVTILSTLHSFYLCNCIYNMNAIIERKIIL